MKEVKVYYVMINEDFIEESSRTFDSSDKAKRWDRWMQKAMEEADMFYSSKIEYPESD